MLWGFNVVPLLMILIAVLLIVPAIRGDIGALGSALRTDVPPFAAWFFAVLTIGLLGLVPGLRGPSRLLGLLVVLVIVLTRYSTIVTGFRGAVKASTVPAAPTGPAVRYTAATGNGGLLPPPLASSVQQNVRVG